MIDNDNNDNHTSACDNNAHHDNDNDSHDHDNHDADNNDNDNGSMHILFHCCFSFCMFLQTGHPETSIHGFGNAIGNRRRLRHEYIYSASRSDCNFATLHLELQPFHCSVGDNICATALPTSRPAMFFPDITSGVMRVLRVLGRRTRQTGEPGSIPDMSLICLLC